LQGNQRQYLLEDALEEEQTVSKHKKGMILSAVMMFFSLILLLNIIMNDQGFRLANIASFAGLFLCGLFLFVSHWNSHRKGNRD
jgi:hypothetical protein